MKPLDLIAYDILDKRHARLLLDDNEYQNFCSIEEDQKKILLEKLLTLPIDTFTPINELYFRSKWATLFSRYHGGNPFRLLEVASGDADMIPQTMARTNPSSEYLTANMNVKLNESLLKKTAGLDISLRLVDDDAANIRQYIPDESIDVIAFQHGANDVIQAILCGQNGVDTVYSDWMETLPKMIELLKEEILEGSFEKNVKEPFLSLISNLLPLLKKDGFIAISHYMFKLDLDWGYPPELFENIVPIVRRWINDLDCEEVFEEGFDSQWWIFIKK